MDAVLSTAYLPNIEYFVKLVQCSQVLVEQHENYTKQTYRNRCDILTAGGVMPLIIPVKRKHGEKMPIREVRIDYDTDWQTIHWRAITAAYRSSAFFEYYADDLLPFYKNREEFLFDFNMKFTNTMMELCGINTEIVLTSQYVARPEGMQDFRSSIRPKSKTENDSFKIVPYYQVFADRVGFVPGLSILDLLCNEGNNAWPILKASGE